MENLIVIIIVGVAAGLLGRSYYKKFKKGNQCSCGCTSCSTDTSSCEFPEERDTASKEAEPRRPGFGFNSERKFFPLGNQRNNGMVASGS